MKKRKLGSDLEVSAVGLGCMGMSEFYGAADERSEEQSIATIHSALEIGVNFLDTADMYGPYINEELVGKAIKGKRDEFVIATKFGIWRDPVDTNKRSIKGKPEYVRQAVEGSLKRLGIETIDLYYQHRVDPETPIEETVGAMAELVKEGKVKYLGLSEASAETLRRASRVHPITALQSEYSLWTRDVEDNEVLAACRELNIGFVAYSPLGRGFLSGEIKRFEDLAADDYRRQSPRFQGENFDKNIKLVEKVEEIARAKGVTTSQLALAWVLAQGQDIVPIPGTKRRKYLEQNAETAEIILSQEELAAIEDVFPKDAVSGLRYPEAMMKSVNA
ncbi:MAG: aldo/keto reductase [Acidobacteria bacterium]|jgi:aryl-alcohol dehydrogenase-like predicted oxidoreductase|nr:aldo/keto reductase [Acidobacteriota bacterium]